MCQNIALIKHPVITSAVLLLMGGAIAFCLSIFPSSAFAATDYRYIAHKGKISVDQPESQLSTFQETAQNENVYALETDIFRTGDGRYVCVHGKAGKTATWGGLDVKTTKCSVLKSVHPDGQTICKLKEFLGVCKSANKKAVIDLKDVRFATKKSYTKTLVDICYNMGMLQDCRFVSCQAKAVGIARTYAIGKYGIRPEGFAIARDSHKEVNAAIKNALKYNLTGIDIQKNQLKYAYKKIKQIGDLQLSAYVYTNPTDAAADGVKYACTITGEFPV